MLGARRREFDRLQRAYWTAFEQREQAAEKLKMSKQRLMEFVAGETSGLTPREAQVLGLLSEGRGNKDIATRMNITVRTVKFYASEIYKKLGVSGRSQLLSF